MPLPDEDMPIGAELIPPEADPKLLVSANRMLCEKVGKLEARLRECADLLEHYADLDEMDCTEALLVHSALEDARRVLGDG